MERKVEAGAQFAVTQPVYDEASVRELADAVRHMGIPVVLGILPLRTARYAEFLDQQVSGIAVPEDVRERVRRTADATAERIVLAPEMLTAARRLFAGPASCRLLTIVSLV